MGLLATEFDEKEFKIGYAKVIFQDMFKEQREDLIRRQKETIINFEKKQGIKIIDDSDIKVITVRLYKSDYSYDFISEITGLSINEVKNIIYDMKNVKIGLYSW